MIMIMVILLCEQKPVRTLFHRFIMYDTRDELFVFARLIVVKRHESVASTVTVLDLRRVLYGRVTRLGHGGNYQ